MTEHEMRIRLAEAMGWTETRDIPAGGLVGVPPGGGGALTLTPVPHPLESDADAARLRAWLVDRGWCTSLIVSSDYFGVEVTIYGANGEPIDGTPITVTCVGEPDPCRRERLALCRAVVQARDAIIFRRTP